MGNCSSGISYKAATADLVCVKSSVYSNENINLQNKHGYTPLMLACRGGHLELVQYLVEQGADIKDVNKYGYDALTLASKFGHFECLKYLVENGSDVCAENKHGRTALMMV